MGVLTGLKILDFTTLLPGPFATMMLSDMGAEVVKVESPYKEDAVQHIGPRDREVSAVFEQLHRSKKSISLDLKKEKAKEIIFELIQEYDIVMEQFRPGVMDRLGIGYDELKKHNPEVIFCSITGYGQTGSLARKAGHDINYLALSGATSYSARRNEAPVPTGIQVADIAGGSMPAVVSVLAAVYHRIQTGEGQAIDISITDNVYSLNALYGSAYLAGGEDPRAESLLLNGGSFYDYYETKDGRYFSVGSLEPKFQKELCKLLGDPSLTKLSNSPRTEDQRTFKEIVKESFKQKTYDEWLEVIGEDFDGCVEPVLYFSETLHHPQVKERELIIDVPKPKEGTQKQIAFPIKFSKTEPVYQFTGVATGSHTKEILESAGFSLEEIESFSESGLFGKE